MKKKFLLIVCMLGIALIVVAFANRKANTLFKDDVSGATSFDKYTLLYVMNEKEQLVGINVGTNDLIEDEIKYKWNLLTINSNLLPNSYESPIYLSTQLVNYEINENTMTMNLSDDFLFSEGRKVLECLAYNFCNDQIKEISINVNDVKITSFENMKFDTINKNIGCNLTFETDNLLETDDLTMVFHYDDYIMPVTYYYDSSKENFNILDYIVFKAVSIDEYVSTIDFNNIIKYEIKNNKIEFITTDNIVLSTETINTLSDSLKINYQFEEILLNGVNI